MRSCPRLAAIAFVAGVVAPCLGNRSGGRRGRGEPDEDFPEPPECPEHDGVYLLEVEDGWYYCELCDDFYFESDV